MAIHAAARCCRPVSTLSSWSSAGHVRKSLGSTLSIPLFAFSIFVSHHTRQHTSDLTKRKCEKNDHNSRRRPAAGVLSRLGGNSDQGRLQRSGEWKLRRCSGLAVRRFGHQAHASPGQQQPKPSPRSTLHTKPLCDAALPPTWSPLAPRLALLKQPPRNAAHRSIKPFEACTDLAAHCAK